MHLKEEFLFEEDKPSFQQLRGDLLREGIVDGEYIVSKR